MNEKHLPGSINNRIRELRERDKMTQAELAAKLGISPSTLGRIEKGEIEKVSSDILVKLARVFEVSTDFLLGITDYPDRMNYEVGQLGLTPEAVRKLRSGAVNVDALNGMLNSRYFPAMSQSVASYTDGTVSEGIKIHNGILSAAMGMTQEYPDARREIGSVKIPGTMEQEHIASLMRYMLKDMKDKAGQSVTADNAVRDAKVAEAITKEIGTMVEKGRKVTPEIIADVVLGKVVEACDLEANALDAFRQPIIDLMKRAPRRKKLE